MRDKKELPLRAHLTGATLKGKHLLLDLRAETEAARQERIAYVPN